MPGLRLTWFVELLQTLTRCGYGRSDLEQPQFRLVRSYWDEMRLRSIQFPTLFQDAAVLIHTLFSEMEIRSDRIDRDPNRIHLEISDKFRIRSVG
jgi:hypothetical protein